MLRDTDFGPSQPAVTADSLSKYFVSKVEAIRALTLHSFTVFSQHLYLAAKLIY